MEGNVMKKGIIFWEGCILQKEILMGNNGYKRQVVYKEWILEVIKRIHPKCVLKDL